MPVAGSGYAWTAICHLFLELKSVDDLRYALATLGLPSLDSSAPSCDEDACASLETLHQREGEGGGGETGSCDSDRDGGRRWLDVHML